MTDWAAYDMWRSCSSKRRYRHKGQAWRIASRLNQRAYKCRYCEGYHTTSQTERR